LDHFIRTDNRTLLITGRDIRALSTYSSRTGSKLDPDVFFGGTA
jgi:hypothetical protein